MHTTFESRYILSFYDQFNLFNLYEINTESWTSSLLLEAVSHSSKSESEIGSVKKAFNDHFLIYTHSVSFHCHVLFIVTHLKPTFAGLDVCLAFRW